MVLAGWLKSSSDHERTKRVVADFVKNEGPALHQKLVDYAAGRAVSCAPTFASGGHPPQLKPRADPLSSVLHRGVVDRVVPVSP